MRNYLLKLSLLTIISLTALSCNDDESSPGGTEAKYPIKLAFEKEGKSELEYWKGGILTQKNPTEYVNYFDNESCLNYFNQETDLFCKSTEVVFLDDSKLQFTYNNRKTDLSYKFSNDTLKVINENNEVALGVGDKKELKIYGSLFKYKSENQSGCGGDEFHKYSFNGQFFINASENHNLPFTRENMGAEDEVIFYNREYILGK